MIILQSEKERRLTITEVANQTGIHESTIMHWEQKEMLPTVSMYPKIIKSGYILFELKSNSLVIVYIIIDIYMV
ncbi:MAG: hypothetical protein R2753_07320 [Chitinophagales bacterium]